MVKCIEKECEHSDREFSHDADLNFHMSQAHPIAWKKKCKDINDKCTKDFNKSKK